MIRHGLTPAEALAAAASTAAQALDLAEHIGTVAEGKAADLLITDGDRWRNRGCSPTPAGSGSYCNSVPDRQALERDIGVTASEPVIK